MLRARRLPPPGRLRRLPHTGQREAVRLRRRRVPVDGVPVDAGGAPALRPHGPLRGAVRTLAGALALRALALRQLPRVLLVAARVRVLHAPTAAPAAPAARAAAGGRGAQDQLRPQAEHAVRRVRGAAAERARERDEPEEQRRPRAGQRVRLDGGRRGCGAQGQRRQHRVGGGGADAGAPAAGRRDVAGEPARELGRRPQPAGQRGGRRRALARAERHLRHHDGAQPRQRAGGARGDRGAP